MSSLEAPDNKNLELVISDRDMKRMQRVGKENADRISYKDASDIFWQENSLVRLAPIFLTAGPFTRSNRRRKW